MIFREAIAWGRFFCVGTRSERLGLELIQVGGTTMKTKLSAAAIVSSVAIASSVLLSSATPSEACMYGKARYQQKSWFQSPLAAVVALPGIALATALYLGGRSYQN
jgi:hypothetical protein